MFVGGCTTDPTDAPPPTIEPAQAAVSPAVTATPDGEIRQLRGHAETAVFDPTTGTLAVLAPGAGDQSTLTLLTGEQPVREITLRPAATALGIDGTGDVLAATRGGYLRVDIARATSEHIEVDDADAVEFTAVAVRADGNPVLGSADGAVYTLRDEHAVANRLKAFARVDGLVTQGDTAVVLDRGQTSVTALTTDGAKVAQALRAGEGATIVAADPLGRVLVADTRGDELLVFSADPLIMRQRYPVPAAPYGLAGSSDLAWVSQTAANTVIGYDLSTGIPVEKVRYRTVQQPDSLAYDDNTDTLYVVSGVGGGVQVIPNAAGRQ